MSRHPALEKLRERLDRLEETQRQFSRTVPIADTVDRWMPHGGLPAGCIHEVKGTSLATALAFSVILSARLAGDQGNIVYIAPDRSLHPLGLLPYGMGLDQLLLVSGRRSQDLAWAVMEALRCPKVSAVVAILAGLDLTSSAACNLRQKAAEQRVFSWVMPLRRQSPHQSHDGKFHPMPGSRGKDSMSRHGRSISSIAAAVGRGAGAWNGVISG
jgi:hypothetical protein